MRVLARGRIEHEEAGVRRGGVELLQHPVDLLKLIHQVRLVLQASCRIDDQHVGLGGARTFKRLKREARGIGTGFGARDHRAARAAPPDLQLLDRGGAEGVSRHQGHRAALGAELARELANGRGLAGAIYARDQNHVRLVGEVERKRARHGLEDVRDLGCERRAHLFIRHLAAELLLAQRLDQIARGLDAEVGRDQRLLEFVQHRPVELAPGEDRADRAGQALRGLGEAGLQAREQPALAALLLFGVFHAALAIRWSRSRAMARAETIAPAGSAPLAIRAGR